MLFKFRFPFVPAALGVVSLALSSSTVLAAGAVTTADTQVFDSPVPPAGVITVIPAGTRVSILWCEASPQLCLISSHKLEGFVSAASLAGNGNAGPFGGAIGKPIRPTSGVADVDPPRALAEGNADGGGSLSGPLQARDFGGHTISLGGGGGGGTFTGISKGGTGPIKIGK